MARFGQGINPQLSAVDYSPIMQGTQVAAQGIAQGGAAIGNALAQLGQVAGAAVQGYYKQKEEKEFLDTSAKAVSSFLTENPDFAKQIGVRDPNDPKLVKTLFKELGGGNPLQGAQAVRGAMMQYQAMEPQRQEQKAIGVALSAIQTGKMNPLDAVRSVGLPLTPGVANFVSQYQQTQAQTGKTLAETAKLQAPEPYKPQKIVDPVSYTTTGPNGQPIEVTVDRFTGQTLGQGAKVSPFLGTPQDRAAAADLENRAKLAGASVDAFFTSVKDSAKAESEMNRAIELLDQGVKTGFGQDFITSGKKALKAVGFDVGNVASAEELRALLGRRTLDYIAATKGAVSDKEMEQFSNYSANFGNTPEGNKQILEFGKKVIQRQREAADIAKKMLKEGKPSVEIQMAIDDFINSKPITLSAPAEALQIKPLSPAAQKYLKGK